MNNYQINELQKGLEKAARILHPDNEISYAITKRYRELERLKEKSNRW